MRFWFLHSSDVPLQDQIVTQVSLGILSGELAPGERLPSVRELARRFAIHPNTVSLGYRRLERDHWVECRRGSGVYIRAQSTGGRVVSDPVSSQPVSSQPVSKGEHVDRLVGKFVEAMRTLGVDGAELCERVGAAVRQEPIRRLLLIEPDPELRRIVVAELEAAVELPIVACEYAPSEVERLSADDLAGTMVLALPSKAEAVRAGMRTSTRVTVLRVRSIPQSLEPWLPARTNALVGIASHWTPFLDFARTMLVAAGFASDALLQRDARSPGWSDGLEEADAVICDAYTAALLRKHPRVIRFGLLADESLAELRAMAAGVKVGQMRM